MPTEPRTNVEDVVIGDVITVLVLADQPYESNVTVTSIERKPRPEFIGGGEYINLRLSDGGTAHLSTGRTVKVVR